MHSDSVDKIIQRYFAVTTKASFTYKGATYQPKPLTVSPHLLRGYTCPKGCGGCCHLKFTLDYLPDEDKPDTAVKRLVEFDGRKVPIFTDFQSDNETNHCQNLRLRDGRCLIYEVRPFSCDFELIRTLEYSEDRPNVLTQKLFGRGWNMLRVDGERGALCGMTPVTEDSKAEVVRKLNRLRDWASHFGIRTWAEEVIELIEESRLTRSITLACDSAQPRRTPRLF